MRFSNGAFYLQPAQLARVQPEQLDPPELPAGGAPSGPAEILLLLIANAKVENTRREPSLPHAGHGGGLSGGNEKVLFVSPWPARNSKRRPQAAQSYS